MKLKFPRSEWRLALGLLICGLIARTWAFSAPTAPASVFFVATNGNDRWSGTRDFPNLTRTDGPFATVARAVAAVRSVKTSGGASAGASPTILIRSGLYMLPEPLVLGPQDSGLRLEAYNGEKPVLSGGRRIRGWKPIRIAGQRMWAAEIPEVREGKWFFRELWINGRRVVRARYPNQGYLSVADLAESTKDWTQGHQRFCFRAGDVRAWPSASETECLLMSRWVESRLPVGSIDEAGRVIHFTKRSVFETQKGDLYFLEGARDFLDAPEEWYLARNTGMLYYWPRPDERWGDVEAIAPALSQVLRLEGKPESGQFVEGVVLQGLTFSHTEWMFQEPYQPAGISDASQEKTPSGYAQAAVGVPGAVVGQGVRGCVWENCAFVHLGNYGLELARGCQDNRIRCCEFSDLGAGGMKLGEGAIRSRAEEQTGGNTVSDCHIYDGGKLFPSAVGIWIGQSPNNRLTHNSISDFYYTGISIGWTWGYGQALATNNLVAFNHVHHIGKRSDGDGPILSDMGGIYTLGMQPGTRIVNNLWHDIAAARYGGWGIYLDEGSSSIEVKSNLVYRTTHGGFHQHYGATNRVQNNIFAFARDHQVQRSRPEPHRSFSFTTNIVYFDTGVVLGGNWSGDQYEMDWNLYFDVRQNTRPEQTRFADGSLDQWRQRGHDLHSLLADPLFVAPERQDFGLRPGSPATTIGFKPIDLSGVGIRKEQH